MRQSLQAMTTAPLTILRKDYLTIVETLVAEAQLSVSRAVKFCAAKLLNVFERLTTWKKTAYSLPLDSCLFWIPIFKKPRQEDTGQQLTLEVEEPSKMPRSLYDELQGEHCRESISNAVQLLRRLGLIDVQSNPYNGQDRTYWYKLYLDKLHSPTPQDDMPSLKIDASTSMIDEPNCDVGISRTITESRSDGLTESFSQTTNEPVAELDHFDSDPTEPISEGLLTPLPTVKGDARLTAQNTGEDTFSAAAATVDFSQQIKALGIELNDNVQRRMKKFGDRVQDAIGYVDEQRQVWAVGNPTGLFMRALKRGDKPSSTYQQQAPKPTSAYHDPSRFWGFLDSANARFNQEGIAPLVVWLNGLWREEKAYNLVEYLLRESAWGCQAEINRVEDVVEVAF
ncbi:MAG: hypothetical protein HC781_01665 [Leptolyngbyaceae cyanobacterium CSU_1_4]|nr:hypothetical protein [Leptolyngbyaceae cyanobacterium CSU_1_4]